MVNLYRTIARIIPKKVRDTIKEVLVYSSIGVNHETFIGFLTLFSVLLGLLAGFSLGFLFKLSFWLLFLCFTLGINVLVYLWILLQIDRKAKLIEEALPDALQLMSANLRAGMTPDKALLLSARPEFGPLKDEIDLVGKQVTLGENVGTALLKMAGRVKSRRLIRTVELINSGLDSGGSLATLLEATSNDLREQFLVDKKIKASITMYVIFIFSAAAIVTPILFALSTYLVEVLQETIAGIDFPASSFSSLPIAIGKISLTQDFLIMYTISFLSANSLMASIILGLIGKGKHRQGLHYFIPMILLSIPLFFLIRTIVRHGMGGLFS